jgi:hypothetical protein
MLEGRAVRWQQYQTRRPAEKEINMWHEAGLLTGVGVICGTVSRNLVVIDLDGDDAILAWGERWNDSDLLNTWIVASGSGHGWHIYLYALQLPPTTRAIGTEIGNVEIRANGCYVVAPPSIHPTGQPYRVLHRAPVRTVAHLDPVVQWVKSLIKSKHGGTMPAPSGKVRHTSAYGRAALAGECAAVHCAAAGSRNNQLYRSALKLGSLVATGKLDRGTVEAALMNAAAGLSSEDGEMSSWRTIQSGLERGLGSPRDEQGSSS